ncbi:hypothetical protein K461DRAFT_275596 [Myriangium duriaei CBS 260.36]|uniref:BHLH domain-containing protein n=1 Tax=Myriangium duriaei CBS 260.36 TaxID=1168546 RepID=A0A9P4J9E8_9PEZI|nr:hypothetical protein K461DRAFT_275596 [Myriangium duriaei CBS 260.36]
MEFSTPPDIPDLVGYAVPYSPDDWEDWLRWDPSTESLSPNSTSKDSAVDSTINDDSFSWLKADSTIDPTLVVGDDSGMDLAMDLGPSAIDFAAPSQMPDPFVFGGDNVKPTTTIPWPTIEVPQQESLQPISSNNKSRRVSASTVNTDNIESQQLSPASHTQTHSSMSSLSPQPAVPQKKKPGRKRKSEMVNAEGNNGTDGEPPVKKTSHNVIEKRYRNNLNDKILELRDSVPSLRVTSKQGGDEDESEDLEGLTPAHKLNKSTIMAKATEYIKHLEKRNKTLADDMTLLKNRLSALEQAYARSTAVSDRQNSAVNRSRQSSNQTASPIVGMQSPIIASPNPDSLRRQSLVQPQQPMTAFGTSIDEIAPPPAPTTSSGDQAQGDGTGFMGKLMLGSMAGLMAMEGYFEHEQGGQSPSSRGLASLPVHLFRRGMFSLGSSHLASQTVIPFLKFSLVLGCIVYLIAPLLHSSKPKHKRTISIPQITLTAAPSLASPVETRRKAWLTAIQSVWTPRPFLLEVVAVGMRMAELSVRRLVGFDRYAELLGMSKDDEAARIKAWDIAIDAQLAGGDAEVSYYRLLLTLMASGTLPDSPIRLMQKAVHFRIFFWEVAHAGYGNLFMFKAFTAKVARIYWDSARNQQKALLSGNASKVDELDHKIELLPDHLAALIELECDEVLTDDVIQRAYNLAWNRPSAEKTTTNATLDKVVEDPAIRSPLDAVAAWFTNTVVDEALALSIHAEDDIASDLSYLVKLAATTAPPASSTLTRAYVARAVLIDSERELSISSALESMPHVPFASPMLGRSPTTTHLNVVTHVPLTPEVRTALTLAKLLSICSASNPTSSQSHAAGALANLSLQPKSFTLLTAIAAYRLLAAYTGNPVTFARGKDGLERLAIGLRLWAGAKKGKAGGLSRAETGRVIERCLSVTKRVGGWREEDGDSGYGSEGAR